MNITFSLSCFFMLCIVQGFENLTSEDQSALQKESKTEVMFLHAAQLYSGKESTSGSKKKKIFSSSFHIVM